MRVWRPTGLEWKGMTVAVLGSGPSLTKFITRGFGALQPDKVVAVNYVCRIAPWADMLVALDAEWPQEFKNFRGLRVTGSQSINNDALYIGKFQETFRIDGAHAQVRNSGLAALRIAGMLGAARIVLAGFDPQAGGHFYNTTVDDSNKPERYRYVEEGLGIIAEELRAQGVIVERYT